MLCGPEKSDGWKARGGPGETAEPRWGQGLGEAQEPNAGVGGRTAKWLGGGLGGDKWVCGRPVCYLGVVPEKDASI